jgi:hypothetical protein
MMTPMKGTRVTLAQSSVTMRAAEGELQGCPLLLDLGQPSHLHAPKRLAMDAPYQLLAAVSEAAPAEVTAATAAAAALDHLQLWEMR